MFIIYLYYQLLTNKYVPNQKNLLTQVFLFIKFKNLSVQT